jgi:hypothetical protein
VSGQERALSGLSAIVEQRRKLLGRRVIRPTNLMHEP